MIAGSCAQRARVHALVDGELTEPGAADVRDHVAGCADCQAELSEVLQLAAAVATSARPALGAGAPAWRRRRGVQVAAGAMALAAGVAVYVALVRPPVQRDVAGATVALAPSRVLEARLAWSGAAAFRPYAVQRADLPAHEAIALGALAALEARGDYHGIGALELLTGEHRQAARFLDRAGAAAAVQSDRAALALADGQPERALSLADAVLELANPGPAHGPALWNRALALRELGLTRAAAAAFRELARRGEPGWAEEARARAAALDAQADALQHRFERIRQASVALVRGEFALSVDDARAMPGFARGVLYDAIRAATTPDQLGQLAPLAQAIDGADHGTAMADALARARAALQPAQSRQYADMIRALAVEAGFAPSGDAPAVPAGPARARWLDALRAAGADDLRIGVLMKTAADRRVVDDAELAELARLAAASPDPWMQLLGLQQQAEASLRRDDLVGAEAILLRAQQRCAGPGAPAFRCIQIGRLLGKLYVQWQRLGDARAVLTSAWQASRRAGEWIVQEGLLEQLAELAMLGDDAEATGLPLVRAYTDELVRRSPDGAPDVRCDRVEWGRVLRAMLLVDRLAFAAARDALAGPACSGPQAPVRAATLLFVRAEIASQLGTPGEVTELRSAIAALRAAPSTEPAQQVQLDHSEGRLLIDRDPAAGQLLLRRAIAAAKALPPSAITAHKAAAWSYSVLAVTAARRGDGDAALAALAEENGLALPPRCVLGLAIEDQWQAVVARDAAGRTLAYSDDNRRTPAIEPARLVPASVVAALTGCTVVDVIARPPIHGSSRVLPDAIAWRYLSHPPVRSSAHSPAQPSALAGQPSARTSAGTSSAVRAAPSSLRTGCTGCTGAVGGDGVLVIADVEPPSALALPRLAAWSSTGQRLSGAAATPANALAAIGAADEVIIHAHGIVDVAQPDASFLALSADASGRFALTTGDVRAARFATRPLVILAACRAARAAPLWHDTASLPAAFVYAGARAVIASTAPIPDRDADAWFDVVRARIRAGAPVAVAVRDARQQWLEQHLDQHLGGWVQDVIVFE